MGIFDMFTAKPAAAVNPAPGTQNPTGQPANPGTPNGNAHVQNNNTVPNDNNTPNINDPANPNGAQTQPMDAFKDLWNTTPNQQGSNANAPIFQLDQQKLAQAVQGMNFASRIPQEQLAKVAAGGEEAVAALSQIINTVGQTAVSQALAGSAAIAEGGFTKFSGRLNETLPGMVKQHAVHDAFKQENPALSNPAFSPVVTAIQSQIQAKFPNASATEIRKMTSDYFDGLATASGYQKPEEQKAGPAGNKQPETDWSIFLDGSNNMFG